MPRRINRIVIHCSDSAFGDADIITSWHKERGFVTIGYHYVITNGFKSSKNEYDTNFDGLLQRGRPINDVGAHVTGFNLESVGICLIGKSKFSLKQLTTLIGLIRVLMGSYPSIHLSRVVGHNELTKGKTCPNFNVQIIRDMTAVFSDFNCEKSEDKL